MKGDESAFPTKGGTVWPVESVGAFSAAPGLTKRELLAGMALQGILANDGVSERPDLAALEAVRHADALLRELAGEGEGK